MPLFDQTVPVSHEEVEKVVKEHWGFQLGKVIKASQNHTFEASHEVSSTTVKYVVRVTPDDTNKYGERIKNEIAFVTYLVNSDKINHICAPVRNHSGEYIVRSGSLTIVVSEWAKGIPLDFMSYTWMTDRDLAFSWGKWLATFHNVSKQFSHEHPEIAKSVQRWDEMHECILAGSELHPDDVAVMTDKEHYGVLHGDLNLSNFFYMEGIPGVSEGTLSVFDWDQTQQGWYLWDVAQSLLAVNMLHEGGSLVDGTVVVQANPVQFQEWMIEGYESITGMNTVDRARLHRMVQLRKQFYERFCRTAKEQGELPVDMAYFVEYVIRWFDKVKNESNVGAAAATDAAADNATAAVVGEVI